MPLDDAALHLASLLAGSLCHDLAGPVEALASVSELLDQPPLAREAIEVTREATESLSRRLRLLRAVWAGVASPLRAHEIEQFASGLPRIEKLGLDLTGLDRTRKLPAVEASLVLALLLLAAEALPRGGSIGLTDGGADALMLRIEGPGAAWPPGLAAVLSGQGEAEAPTTVLLVAWLARRAGRRLCMLLGAGAAPPLRLEAVG